MFLWDKEKKNWFSFFFSVKQFSVALYTKDILVGWIIPRMIVENIFNPFNNISRMLLSSLNLQDITF